MTLEELTVLFLELDARVVLLEMRVPHTQREFIEEQTRLGTLPKEHEDERPR